MLPCDICRKTTHEWYDCPKRSSMPTGWKPPRLAKHIMPSAVDIALPDGKTMHMEVPPPSASQQQMLSDIEHGRKVIAEAFALPNMLLGAAPSPALRPGRGRPKTIEDMKAYKAKKARERRARLKAEKDAGK